MKFRISIFIAFLLISSTIMYSQTNSLPKMSDDKSIKTGVLPNGMKYYLAANPATKGVVSLSLVQKMDPDLNDQQLRLIARDVFASARCGGTPLEDFLARNGMLPGDEGYVRYQKGSIAYTLGDYANALTDAVLDSTFFALFDLASTALGDNRPSSSLAIVAAGDFNEASFLAKMKTLSIFTAKKPGEVADFKYIWDPSNAKGDIRTLGDATAKVTVRWRDARVPKEYMATALPVISQKMAGELGWILENRLYPAYRAAKIPVWIDISHMDSAQSAGDDVITLSVSCMRSLKDDVERILRNELCRLVTWGIDETEYTYARDAYRYRWVEKSNRSMTNAEYLRRCESSFLYGASMSTDKERILFAYKNVADSTQTRLFNSYMKHLLVQSTEADQTMKMAPMLVRRSVLASFFDAYAPKDELKAPKNDNVEYMTGGVMWTFPNGVNVIYKKMDTGGMMHYCYASKGGREYADEDYFNSIDDVYEENFTNFLSAYGIRMNVNLNPSDVRLEGNVPAENFEKMLTVLAALSNQKENGKVFAPTCYKLLVLVGNMDVSSVKAVMASYVSSLRPGGKWAPVAASADAQPENLYPPDCVMSESVFPLDLSMSNLALADVASYGIYLALGRAFAGEGMTYFQQNGFIGFPTNNYRVAFGVKAAPLDNFPSSESRLPEYEAERKVAGLLRSLAGSSISATDLKVCKALAAGAFEAYKNTPQYYIDIACDRYLSNKDIRSKYSSAVDKVSAAAVKKFYETAASAAR